MGTLLRRTIFNLTRAFSDTVMARTAGNRRVTLLTALLLAASACFVLHKIHAFVTPDPCGANRMRRTSTAMQADLAKKGDEAAAIDVWSSYKTKEGMKTAINVRESWQDGGQASLRPVRSGWVCSELSTGAEQTIRYVTPPITSLDLQRYFSLTVTFLGSVILLQLGLTIEFQRFFPDATYW